uniref:NADH dehydrogenase subunit 4L n=1 Tax=Aspidophiura sp. TaxID=3135528 RepID=A0AAU6QCU4_9ECHI
MPFIFYLVLFSCFCSLLSLLINSKFLLSILLALELFFLNLLILCFFSLIFSGTTNCLSLCLFILSFSAIEASIGISLLSLITRSYNLNNFNALNLLKN